MPNDFRRHLTVIGATTGSGGNSSFISKAGSPANDGLTPETPKPVFNNAVPLAKLNVFIGAGYYRATGTISYSNGGQVVNYYGEGLVVIDMQGFDINCAQFSRFDNIILINIGKLNLMQFGSSLSGSVFYRTNIAFAARATTNIVYADTRNYIITFEDCNIKNGFFNETNGRSIEIKKCNLFNTELNGILTCERTYISVDSKVRKAVSLVLNTSGTPTATGNFDINNVLGSIALGLVDTYKTLSQYKVDYPTSNQASISAPPLFNNESTEDYTLKSTSPHLLLGVGPSNLRYSNSYFASFQNKQPGDIITAADVSFIPASGGVSAQILTLTPNAFTFNSQGGIVLLPPAIEGEIIFDRVFNSDIASQLSFLNFVGGLNYDTDYPTVESGFNANAPEIFNNNVPDYSNYVSGTAGRNPNRLSYKIRWSILKNPRVSTNTDWVTNALLDPFLEMEWNSIPSFRRLDSDNTKIIGNADPLWRLQTTTIELVYCTWYQAKVMLRNNYYSK